MTLLERVKRELEKVEIKDTDASYYALAERAMKALGWRRVEDELPEGAGGVVIVEYGLTTWATAESVRHDPEGITHWLPLPPLPEESKDLKAQEGE